MAEYIDREETKKAFGLNFGSVMDAVYANRIVDSIPAADIAPVRHARWMEGKKMRLIDADGLIDRIKQKPTDGMYTHEIIEAITEQPTVDAVEVIRCKDCKYGLKSHLHPYCGEKEYLCRYVYEGYYHEANHWCAYGKRLRSEEEKQMKEEGNNGC